MVRFSFASVLLLLVAVGVVAPGLVAPVVWADGAKNQPAISIGLLADPDPVVTKSLFQGLSLALRDQAGNRGPLPVVVTERTSSRWSNAGSAAVRLASRPGLLAIVAPPDRRVSHLAAQVGTRTHVPVLSTSRAATVRTTGSTWVWCVAPGASELDPKFGAAYRAAYGTDPTPAAVAGYEAGRAFTVALATGARSHAALRKALGTGQRRR